MKTASTTINAMWGCLETGDPDTTITPIHRGVRVEMQVRSDDAKKVTVGPGYKGIVTDLDDGKRYTIWGIPCGCRCYCDAEILGGAVMPMIADILLALLLVMVSGFITYKIQLRWLYRQLAADWALRADVYASVGAITAARFARSCADRYSRRARAWR
jgi:hypothetical protein